MNNTCYAKLIEAYKDKRNVNLIFNSHKIKITQILKEIESFSLALEALGFKKGDTLTLYLPTCPQAIVAFYACSKLGIIANIVHPLLTIEQLIKNLEKTKSKGLMFYDIIAKDQRQLEKTGQILIDCSVADYTFFRKGFFWAYIRHTTISSKVAYHFKGLINKFRFETRNAPPKIVGEGEDVVTSMHSGGTSGSPKIVKLTNAAFNSLCDNLFNMYTKFTTVGKNEYGMVALPIFHAYGLGVSIHTCLCNRYNLILMPKFSAKKVIKYIKQYNVTFMAGVPAIFKKMMEERSFEGPHLKKLKDIWCGGDVVSENLIEHFDEKLKKYNAPARLMRGYGLTEVCSVCAVNTLQDYKKNSCGKPIPETEIQIRTGDNNEKLCQANQLGEIFISSPCIMAGYEDGSGLVEFEGKKWVQTGDIGYLDQDGFLFVVDRVKRMIKIAAFNIFPAEIEDVARKHPLVKEACAVPYHYNDKAYIKLFVTLNDTEGGYKPQKITTQILNLIKRSLIKYATPHEVVIIDQMPMTQLGKIDYKKLEMM